VNYLGMTGPTLEYGWVGASISPELEYRTDGDLAYAELQRKVQDYVALDPIAELAEGPPERKDLGHVILYRWPVVRTRD
jgi:hypothetical protein